jgi:hypothetical protein
MKERFYGIEMLKGHRYVPSTDLCGLYLESIDLLAAEIGGIRFAATLKKEQDLEGTGVAWRGDTVSVNLEH